LLAVVLADAWIPKTGGGAHNSESAAKSLLVNFSPILIPVFPLFALLMGPRMGQRQYAIGLCAMCASFLLFAARLTLTHRSQAILLERLAASHERLRTISSATNDAVWDWHFATGKLWWGEGFFKLFGFMPEDITADMDWSKFLYPEDDERVRRALLSS
jgi:PAS domain-containing protein